MLSVAVDAPALPPSTPHEECHPQRLPTSLPAPPAKPVGPSLAPGDRLFVDRLFMPPEASAPPPTSLTPPPPPPARREACAPPPPLPPSPRGPLEPLCGFVPYQLSAEMYANIYRNPAAFGYPEVASGTVARPKFGYIFVETRAANGKRPKLLDGPVPPHHTHPISPRSYHPDHITQTISPRLYHPDYIT